MFIRSVQAYIILFGLLITSTSGQLQEEDEFSLIDVTDNELETEFRRRIGGPWSAEDAVSIFNSAIDYMTSKNRSTRTRRFYHEAKALVEILTGEEAPLVESSQPEEADAEYDEEPVVVGNGHTVSLSTMRKVLDMYEGINGQRRRSHEGLQSLYPWYHRSYIERFRKKLQEGGSRRDKLQALDKAVLDIFRKARDNRQPVHGRNIQRWALQQANRTNLEGFLASDTWLYNFKRRNRIVSRKVTVYTSRTEAQNAATIASRIQNFTRDYAQLSRSFDMSDIWNYDQSGFNYEPSNLRTLSFKGERDTNLLIDSRDRHTHSYTVQPIISRSGRLFPKVLIVTQEAGDDFGPIVSARIRELEQKFGNVEVYASKSGKLTSRLVDKWYHGTLHDAISGVKERKMMDSDDGPAVLLIADSWNGHSKASQQRDLLMMGAEMLKIPPQTTDRLQPLDVNFNRQLKIFYNRINEEAFYEDSLANITSREGIINVHSLMHNQMSSVKYRDMILYAWKHTDPAFNSSILINHPPKMVNNIQFDFDPSSKCQKAGCDRHAFIKCAHCGQLLCLHHFLNRTCFHTSQAVEQRSSRIPRETCETEADACEEESEDESEAEETILRSPHNNQPVIPSNSPDVVPPQIVNTVIAGATGGLGAAVGSLLFPKLGELISRPAPTIDEVEFIPQATRKPKRGRKNGRKGKGRRKPKAPKVGGPFGTLGGLISSTL